jgi:hypothetical protein
MLVEDSTFIGIMISSIVEFVVFLPFELSSQRDHMILQVTSIASSLSAKSKILSTFLMSKS